MTAVFSLFTVTNKAVPLKAWSDPEDSRKLRFPDVAQRVPGS
jgi:hypothetical protein